MKKKLVGSLIALTFAVMIGINANVSLNNQVEETAIALSNVEALASGEGGGSYCKLTRGEYYCEPWGTLYSCYCSIN